MKCEECYYRRMGKCELKTEAAVEKVRAENMKLLEKICKASTPRFVDEENLRDQFKMRLDMFYDIGAVLYTLPMREYLPGDDEKDQESFKAYEYLKNRTYDRCIRQAETRILTLGRASCGFVGEYSSGKSSYLNAEAFGNNLLPTDVGKTTSIPTYVFWGRKDLLIYENMQGNILVSEGMDSLKLLSHSSKPDGCPCVFPWNTVIKRIFCFSSDLRINSRDITYVDLPGYSATADDDAAMMEASQGCDKIVYFKPVQSGGLIEKDLEYLKSFGRDDVMVVLSKADKKSSDDCRRTLAAVKKTLEEKEIKVKDVILYSIHPERFARDRGFCLELEKYRKDLMKFITDASAVDNDLSYAESMIGVLLRMYKEHTEEMCSCMDTAAEALSKFLGEKPLDGAFWSEWDNINKSIAASSENYIDTHIFSEDTVRLSDYYAVHEKRLSNCYLSDTYNSSFNYSYQASAYGISYAHLWMTACFMSVTKQKQDQYEWAQKGLSTFHSAYDTAREGLDKVGELVRNIFNNDKYLYREIVNDAGSVFAAMKETYSKLVQYAKKYEKRWY